ncbi:MAG TPA: MlaD family protein [Solirubrobacteraceae bacterium]|nr:MlaD family protein [Solirubrobacteraceae bacterium]
MNRPRRRDASVLTSPVLIGALTVLVTIVAVALAYNANTGLPFVPTYDLHLQARDAEELQRGDDVNEGGALIGVVSSITPGRTRSGRPIAMINLKLDKSAEPLPRDTRFAIRLKGAIGLKYLDVVRGSSRRPLPNGATVPLAQTSSPVDFDRVLSMFNARTRKGVQDTTIGFGQALAGRGADLNLALGAFLPLLRDLRPVAANLASPRTNLAGFFRGLNAFSGALAPVAREQASLFVGLDTTFRSLSSVAPSLERTVSATPPLFAKTVHTSPRIRAFLTDTAGLLRELRPGFATLKTSAPVLADTFRTGARTLPPTASLDRETVRLARRLASYSGSPAVRGGLGRLTLATRDLKQPLAFLAPVQATCNYVTLFLRNTSSVLAQHVSNGGFLRFVQIAIDDLPGRESEPSHTLFTGGFSTNSGPVHSDPYPNTASPGETRECSAGNEGYVMHGLVGNPPGNVGTKTEKTTRSLR